MLKTLVYFFTAIILVGSFKLMQVLFYDVLGPHHVEDKEYIGENEAKKPKEKEVEKVPQFSETSPEDTLQEGTVVEKLDESEQNVQDEPEANSGEIETGANDSEPATTTTLSGESYFQDLKNSYLSPILANLPEGRSREDVVVRYYKHDNDGDRVYALRSLGYYLHEREAEDTKSLESNVLYYGSDVDVRDIKLVAYTLINTGMPLRSIEPSQYDWKYNSLEIGADSLVREQPILTISDIENFNN